MLDKIRNIIYDKNDIIVALFIIVVAAFVITNRMSVIFTYPQAQALAISQSGQTTPSGSNGSSSTATDPDHVGQGETDAPGGTEGETGEGQGSTPLNPEDMASIYIASGDTASTIAQTLYDNGFVPSVESFLAAVDAANAHTRLQAGEFPFPVGATPEEIVAIITR